MNGMKEARHEVTNWSGYLWPTPCPDHKISWKSNNRETFLNPMISYSHGPHVYVTPMKWVTASTFPPIYSVP